MVVTSILVDTSVMSVMLVAFSVVAVDVLTVVALVVVVSVATVGISIVVSSAMTAKLDKWLVKHLTVVELTEISVKIPSVDHLVSVSVLWRINKSEKYQTSVCSVKNEPIKFFHMCLHKCLC